MSTNSAWAAETARIVVESGSLNTRTEGDPFFFSSGWASPVFIDCKKLISVPAARDALVTMAVERIRDAVEVTELDAVAGCELAGVPFATLIADRLNLPLVVVRRQGKGFGRLAQFEGAFEPGARVLLVDDLATDGMSETVFRTALQRAEAVVTQTFVLIDYDVFPSDDTLLSLAKLSDVIAGADAGGHLDAGALREIKIFAADAPLWSKLHGGIGALMAV